MLFMLLPVALAAAPADKPVLSWGKPGVSIDAYRDDANLCASRAWNADVADTEAARVFRQGTQQIDAITQTAGGVTRVELNAEGGVASIDPFELNRQAQIGQIVEGTRPRERMQEVRDLQLDTLAACLRSLGYVRFALTDRQRKALGKLKRGSDERHAFLHRLASDPAVLATQPAGATATR